MNNSSLAKAGIMALVLTGLSILLWELYLRNKGYDLSYDDDPALWSNIRNMAYEPSDKSTVFIGSSRIKFDLDIDTWEKLTGDHAIQLACVGSTPVPILLNLAEDEKFNGRLVIDVTEGLFFDTHGSARRPKENIKYYKECTPAQQASFHINHALESQFVFLNKEWLSLNAQLNQIEFAERKDVYNFRGFPSGFGRVKFNRQEYMTNSFASDTIQQNIVKGIWQSFNSHDDEPPISGKTLDSFINVVKVAVDKIKSRGGKILFIRTPSSGKILEDEIKGYPRGLYWDKLLEATQCDGIHYTDYASMAYFICPESSHLSLTDAVKFTEAFVKILSEEKGWKFKTSMKANN